MTFEKATGIGNNVYLSLMINRGAFVFAPDFGSRLYLLARAKNTPQTAALAEEYCREALAWLVETGRAAAVEVTSRADRGRDPHRLALHVSVTQANGQAVAFTTFVEVV